MAKYPESHLLKPSPHELTGQSEHLLRDQQHLEKLSLQFNIPKSDILLTALNASGIKYQDIENDRGRFILTLPNGRKFLLALTITNQPLSHFEHHQNQILFNGQPVATATDIEKDTCTDSYWRRGKSHLTLNSNSRSNCRGCSFCGTYELEEADKALTTPEAIREKTEAIQTELKTDLSALESIGIVTGCFPDENKLVKNLLMIRQVFAENGFTGELQYIGSQLRTPEKIKEVAAAGPLALYLTVETFQRRQQLMKKTKSSIDLDGGRKLLATAKSLGVDTSFLYIAGLDDHQAMRQQFPLYRDLINRLPQVQTFQAYNPQQLNLRHQEANSIEYFLKTRKIVEQAFPNLRPIAGNNYRSLWFTSYAGHHLKPVTI